MPESTDLTLTLLKNNVSGKKNILFFESDSPNFHFSPHNWTPTEGEMDNETFFTTELPPLFLLL